VRVASGLRGGGQGEGERGTQTGDEEGTNPAELPPRIDGGSLDARVVTSQALWEHWQRRLHLDRDSRFQ